MNYLKLINQFWLLRRSKKITNLQADLYYFLIHEANIRMWPAYFSCSNGTICASIGISEKALIDARNVLKQIGLIYFENGVTKHKSPTYKLLDYLLKVSNAESIAGGIEGGNDVSIAGGIDPNIYKNKTKQNKTLYQDDKSSWPQQNFFESNETENLAAPLLSEAEEERKKSSAQKKKETEKRTAKHWKPMCELWNQFYQHHKQLPPRWNAGSGTKLSNIVKGLEDIAITQNIEWTEGEAIAQLTTFLKASSRDTWLMNHLSLDNLDKQFDKVVADMYGRNVTKGNATKKANKIEQNVDAVQLAQQMIQQQQIQQQPTSSI
jgi:hypothetical protein